MTTLTSPLDRLYARFLALHPDLPMSHLAKAPKARPALRYITQHTTLNRHERRTRRHL